MAGGLLSVAVRQRFQLLPPQLLSSHFAGEAGEAYGIPGSTEKRLSRYTRTILFAKPELVIIFDRLVAPKESAYQYWLHSADKMQVRNDHEVEIRAGDVRCDVTFLAPSKLRFRQTNEYDPNPRLRVKLREWHLTGETTAPAKSVEFVVLYRPHRASQPLPREAELKKVLGGYYLTAQLSDGSVRAILPTGDDTPLRFEGLQTRGAVVLERLSGGGNSLGRLDVGACAAP